jgi:hypothetical protein
MTYFHKLSIMTLLMNSFAATAFMRGSRGHSNQEDTAGMKRARSLASAAAAGQRRHLSLDEDEDVDMKRIIHDTKLLAGSSLMRAAVSSGLSVFDNEQMTECEEIQVAALKRNVNNPQEYTSDTTGAQSYYFDIFDAINGTAASARPLGFFLDMPTANTTIDGVCYKTGGWSFSKDDVINSYARCDGSGFSDAYDQLIVSGTGKFECAIGYVVRNDGESDTITFDIALCKDQSDCL